MEIGQKIRNLRLAKGLKVTELAKKAFVTQPYISDIEKGRTMPSLDKLTLICNALDISRAEFFGKESELPPDILRLLESLKQLTEEERLHLYGFIEVMLQRGKGTKYS
ncbi:helix-turn-helix domain-containing protein [Aureibacillus halotolerans]|uniref:Transcriptional regulator with XRE-family HTH domain n=1 Tax=Aureibacillus halotolerans TaxID=1508390 RepID=A0A4R6U6I5_9BACI|nr:helix-turn-helix transcriptional regulator [Aureibacillus halotolerans]TDQ41242.1 transcriptional regulator with XRE-family HTH domain [Aureibacillus halotolerans]